MQPDCPHVGSDGIEIKFGDYLVRTSDESCGEMTKNATFYQCVELRRYGKIYVKYLDHPDYQSIGEVSGNVNAASFRHATKEEIEAYQTNRAGIGTEFAENCNGTRFYVGDKIVFDESLFNDGDFVSCTVTQIFGAREIYAIRNKDGKIYHCISNLDNAIVIQSERQGIGMTEIEPEAEVDFETIFAEETR